MLCSTHSVLYFFLLDFLKYVFAIAFTIYLLVTNKQKRTGAIGTKEHEKKTHQSKIILIA